jgi:low temperature requirement protein LtrA
MTDFHEHPQHTDARNESRRGFHVRMRGRDLGEDHRASTPLELLFDLCFVVAVAQAAVELHHAIAENHLGTGVLGYLTVFFAIWWAWMNFSWFATAFDTDDVLYRLTTLVQIAGGLVLAAGVSSAFERADFTVITFGYVIMRLAMVAQWLRAARSDPEHRSTALAYALGITIVQVGWLLRLLLPDGLLLPAFFVLVVAEIAVPALAERRGRPVWHPEHIAERYGLFTLIVLGESVLSATLALEAAFTDTDHPVGLVTLGIAGLVILFSMWWIYFEQPAHERLTSLRASLRWGYGHYFVFASAAATGAGLAVAVDFDLHVAHVGDLVAALATTVPVAVFVLVVWLLHLDHERMRRVSAAFPVAAVLIVATSFAPAPIHLTAVVMAVLTGLLVAARRPASQVID